MKTKLPKFKVGDIVTMSKSTLYNETEGEIYKVEKVFKKLDNFALKNGKEVFERGGLNTLESDIKNGCLPYTFDGTYLVVDFGENNQWIRGKQTSKFYGYCYSVKTPKMNTLYSEKTLTLK